MAKRFIDTNLFSDEWFCELSKDTKLFFIYFITSCDHAGVLRLNKKLCEFQTGIKSLETVTKELGNCLVTVKDGMYFMPKFLKFQYPNFPKSKVKQQEGAVKILNSLGISIEDINSYLSLGKELTNSYVSGSDIVSDSEKNKKDKKNLFVPPSCVEVENYFMENNYTQESGRKAWHYYQTANWNDSHGKPVKNWKQKMQGVWFKDENKQLIHKEEVKAIYTKPIHRG